MKRKRHTPQEIIAKLREAEVELNQGATIEAVSRKLEISEQTFHRWRQQCTIRGRAGAFGRRWRG